MFFCQLLRRRSLQPKQRNYPPTPPLQTYLHQIKYRWRFDPTKQSWRKHHRPETSLDGLDLENLFDALMLVNTSKIRSGGKTFVFRVKLTLSEPGKQSQCWFWQNPPPRRRDPPEPRDDPPRRQVKGHHCVSTRPTGEVTLVQATFRGTVS